MLGGGALLLLTSAPTEDWGSAALTGNSVGSIAYLAVIGSAVPFVTLTRLLRELPAVTMSYITLLLPFGALAFGAALYDERVTAAAVAGALLVASGLVIAQWPRRQVVPAGTG
jgi:DME family drug/metabolite transporter